MQRYVAFLRAMNVGGRRLKNDELLRHFADLGLVDAAAFLASGNVVFGSPVTDPDNIKATLESGLRKALGYDVPTLLRSAEETRTVAGTDAFLDLRDGSAGKLQIGFLESPPAEEARRRVLALSSDQDRLEIRGRELYWLPSGNLTDSELDLKAISKALGTMTVRTHRTVRRLVQKLLA